MKFKPLLCLAVFAAPAFLFAQKEITISEADKEMKIGTQNCYAILIPEAKVKNVMDDWKKYVSKGAKGKPEDNGSEIKMIGAMNANISGSPLTIYAKGLEAKDGYQLSAWVSENGAFLSSLTTADKSVAFQKYLHDFAVQEYKSAVNDRLTIAQNKQKDMEKIFDGYVKDQKKSEGNISGYNKDIDKIQGKIKDEQTNIQKAQTNQANARADADKQKASAQQVSDMLNNIK